MAVERRNPLPPGRYWVDVFDRVALSGPFAGTNEQQSFREWLKAFSFTLHVEATETHDSDPPRDWYLFRVEQPTPWLGPGFPTIATPDVKSSADTVQRPDPEKDPLDSGLFDTGARGLLLIGGLLAAGLVLTNVNLLVSKRR